MAAKITSYIDAGGVKRKGFIIDGRTYEDELGSTPVGRGSIVDAGGQRYVKGVGEKGESVLLGDYLDSQNMKATDYVDSKGALKTGYIRDGVTYADILATTPVEKGSIVTAGGKTWIKGVGSDGGSMIYSDYLKSLESGKGETTDNGGSEMLKEMEAGAKEAYERTKSNSNDIYASELRRTEAEAARRKDSLEGEYEQLDTELYRDYMLDRKNLPQILAAQGITGGLSESSLLGLETGYMQNLAENQRRKIAEMADIEASAEDTAQRLFGEKAKADAKAEADYAEKQLEIARLREQQRSEAAEKAAAAEKLIYTRALDKAEALAKLGDFSAYRALGYSEAEIAAMEKAYDEKQFSTRLKIAQQKARYGDASELLALLGL